MGDKPLTPKQAAQLLGVTDRAVRKWATQGLLRGFKVGTDWRFELADVEAFKQYNIPSQTEGSKKAKAHHAVAW